MANFEMTGFDFLLRKLENASKLDYVAPEMINAALPILQDSLKETIRKEADRGYATGEMAESVEKTETKRNRYGYFGLVRPTGMDEKGVRNMEKLAYLHYGTSTQQARPVVTKAVFHAKRKVIEKMQERFNEMIGN